MGRNRSADAEARTVHELLPRDHVLNRLEKLILRHELRAGDPLPDDRLLAHCLGVNVFQVRDGVQALEALGLLRTTAAGTRVISNQDGAARAELLRVPMALSAFAATDLVDVRIQLETCAVRRAAADATPSQVAHLHDLVHAMRDPELSKGQFEDLDDRFHAGLAEAATNALAAELIHAFRDAVAASRNAAFAAITDWPATRRRLVAEHRQILNALADGAGDRAATHLQHHIAAFYATSA